MISVYLDTMYQPNLSFISKPISKPKIAYIGRRTNFCYSKIKVASTYGS